MSRLLKLSGKGSHGSSGYIAVEIGGYAQSVDGPVYISCSDDVWLNTDQTKQLINALLKSLREPGKHHELQPSQPNFLYTL